MLARSYRPRLFALVVSLAGFVSLVCAAPQNSSGQAPQNTNTIRVTTRLVQLGVIVRDKNGAVTNLTKDDFSILEKGKPQTISVFSADATARNEEATRNSPATLGTLPLPAGTFSNLPQYNTPVASGSVTIVLLDNLNTLYGSSPDNNETTPFWTEDLALKNAENHLVKFIGEMKPQDRVAIYALRGSLSVLSDFTTDREQLLALLKKYDTNSVTNREVVQPGRKHAPVLDHEADPFENGQSMALASMRNSDRAAETAAALQQIVGHVSNIPGRKNLVWLTADLPLSGAAVARILQPADIAVYPVDARGLLSTNADMRPGNVGFAGEDEISGASRHFNHLPAQSSQPPGIGAMREIADQTGGQAFVNTSDITGAIRKAVEDSGVTYTLGFYVDAKAADGKFHELKVEVKQKGLTVLYPTGYFAYPEEPPKPDAIRSNIITAVRSPIESSSIPLTASFERTTQAGNAALKMHGRIELGKIALAQAGNVREGAVDIDVVEQDASGKVLGHSADRLLLKFTPDGYPKALEKGVTFEKTLPVYPGAVTLRIIAQDASTGSVGSLLVLVSKIQ